MKREELYLQKNYLKEIITNDFRYIGEIRSIKPINHNDINSKNFSFMTSSATRKMQKTTTLRLASMGNKTVVAFE